MTGDDLHLVTVLLVGGEEEDQTRARAFLDNKRYTRALDEQHFRFQVTQDQTKSDPTRLVVSLTSGCTVEDIELAAQEWKRVYADRIAWKDCPCHPVIVSSFPEASLSPQQVGALCVKLYRWCGGRLYFLDSLGIFAPSVLGMESSRAALELHLCTRSYPPRSHIPVRTSWSTWVIDWLASLFALPPRPKGEGPSFIHDLSDTAPFVPFRNYSSVTLKSPGVLSKQVNSENAIAVLECAIQNTTIPIPRILPGTKGTHLLMERIPGKVLAECWPSLGRWMQFRILCTLRSYIAQMQQLSSHMVGPPSDPGSVSGPLFDMATFRTFASLSAFQYWCRITAMDVYLFSPDAYPNQSTPPPTYTDKELGDLVFTHGDLHQANLILGDDGRLWVIDWDNAGFYPRCFESIAMWAFQDTSAPWAVGGIPWLVGRRSSAIQHLHGRWLFTLDALVRHRWPESANHF